MRINIFRVDYGLHQTGLPGDVDVEGWQGVILYLVPGWQEFGTRLLKPKVLYYIKILLLVLAPITFNDLMAALRYSNRGTFRRNYLQPLIEVGFVGRSYRLQLVEQLQSDLQLKNGRFYLNKDKVSHGADLFKAFYRNKGLKKITERVAKYAPQLGVKPGTIRVQELQHRWGSCTANGDLNFHWKCLMAPLSALDYIVVHELTHLKHRNHDADFWNTLDKVLPEYRKQLGWLREHGASMTL